MQITLEADYAIRIVYCLAQNAGRMDAKSISEETQVTLRFSLKILRKLVASGIVKSYKGTLGGYEVARPLEEISMNDVIEAVSGPVVISRCVKKDFVCPRQADSQCSCKFQKIFDEISVLVQDRLDAVRFSDLVK